MNLNLKYNLKLLIVIQNFQDQEVDQIQIRKQNKTMLIKNHRKNKKFGIWVD